MFTNLRKDDVAAGITEAPPRVIWLCYILFYGYFYAVGGLLHVFNATVRFPFF